MCPKPERHARRPAPHRLALPRSHPRTPPPPAGPRRASGHTRGQPRSSSASRFTTLVLVAMVRLVSCCARCLRRAGVEVGAGPRRETEGDREEQKEGRRQESRRHGEERGQREASRKQEAKNDEETGGMAEGQGRAESASRPTGTDMGTGSRGKGEEDTVTAGRGASPGPSGPLSQRLHPHPHLLPLPKGAPVSSPPWGKAPGGEHGREPGVGASEELGWAGPAGLRWQHQDTGHRARPLPAEPHNIRVCGLEGPGRPALACLQLALPLGLSNTQGRASLRPPADTHGEGRAWPGFGPGKYEDTPDP